MFVKDDIDPNRAKSVALLYLMAEVHGGVVRIYPDVHGLYETWEGANIARNSKIHPEDYYICNAHWRKLA